MTDFELSVHGQLNCMRLIMETVIMSVLAQAPEADIAIEGWRKGLEQMVRFKLQIQPGTSHEDATLVIDETAAQVAAFFERIEQGRREMKAAKRG